MKSLYLYISCLLYIANLKKACGASLFQSELSEKSNNAEDGGVRWREVSVAVRTKKKEFEFLVEPMSGFIPNGHVMALIGPSGAGKSSFLAALSGTTPKGSSTIVSGLVWRESLSSEGRHERYPLSIM
jgi:ABC-type transport system involved in cytochrome bd biosynthesis fused ATPase/permease subunit